MSDQTLVYGNSEIKSDIVSGIVKAGKNKSVKRSPVSKIDPDELSGIVLEMVAGLHSNESIVSALKDAFNISKRQNILRRKIAQSMSEYIQGRKMKEFEAFCIEHGIDPAGTLKQNKLNASYRRLVMTVFLREQCRGDLVRN